MIEQVKGFGHEIQMSMLSDREKLQSPEVNGSEGWRQQRISAERCGSR
jgi:hypothetical protein